MPNFEFRFDLSAVLLASVLGVLGISTANAGGAPGGVVMKGASHAASLRGSDHSAPTPSWGGKGGSQGGDVRTQN